MATAPRRRLLIIDDDPMTVEILTKAIGHLYVIDSAVNGRLGFECAVQTDPDLILLDVMMPVEGGLETCRRLREDARTSLIPILMLTANSDTGTLVASFELGADDFVGKPFNMFELKARIESKIGRRRAPPPGGARHSWQAASDFDPAKMDEWRSLGSSIGRPGFIEELKMSYINANTPLFERLREEALSEDDLVHIFHQAKSSCGNLGFTRLRLLCAAAENGFKQHLISSQARRELVEVLLKEYQVTLQILGRI